MSLPAISVEGLTFTYSGSLHPALRDIDMTVEKGEFVLIAGRSGCGKSTLCKSFVGLIPHFHPGEFKGKVRIFDLDVAHTSPYQLSQRVGYVFQNPDNQIVMTTVDRDIAFGLENLQRPREEIKERIEWVLDLLELSPLAETPISMLSGGEKQKVAIAGVLAMKPDILVLDEPTAYFSPSSALRFFSLLDRLNRDLDLTIVLVEHRLDLAARYASKVFIMEEGSIIQSGDPYTLFTQDLSRQAGVNIPSLVRMFHLLRSRGVDLVKPPLSPQEAAARIEEVLKG